MVLVTHDRLAIAALVAGLRKSGAIDDVTVGIIAEELAAAAEQMARFGAAPYEQMVALAEDVAAGRVARSLPD